jgi:hypothetical protein
MKNILTSFGIILALISVLVFFIGIVLLFFESKKKYGIKMLLFSVIGFVIGFSTCALNFN